MVRVKICGITREADAKAAVDAGADAVGLMFCEGSRRRIGIERARELSRELPDPIWRVGVFANTDETTVRRAIEACRLDTLQFHGEETPEYCERFKPLRIWKAFRVDGPAVLGALIQFKTDAWLLDAAVPGRLGGSGEVFDWNVAVAARQLGRPLVIAGGLTPENVRQAITQVQPFAVDVSSGVESAPGIKDADKIRKFVTEAKGAG